VERLGRYRLSMINHVSVQRVVDVQASATGRDLAESPDIQKAIRSLGNCPGPPSDAGA